MTTPQITTHHMGDGFNSPCGIPPASVYSGFQGGFTTNWDKVDCADCLDKGGRTTEPPLKAHYLTFGVNYPRDPHPRWAHATGDGFVKIMAANESTARGLAWCYFGQHWSMLHAEQFFDVADMQARYYPLGVLATITQGVPAGPESGLKVMDAAVSEVHGVPNNALVGHRIEGVLSQGSDDDGIEALGYELLLVHQECVRAARDLFAEIHDEDPHVMAFELDYTHLPTCPICQKEIR